ncbi:hypothetical protein ONR75_25270 [Rhodopseudomonas sp. P2A-2r]|uniref:hypothetical protein n=1 Tax=Rhodopseudomonas sp. P2A-2r TaxID=2991972 RepID=UPI002234D58F|nr:hypothetical protein [Rhodopseudomonas sp. P2A-2r]UZE48123.1 hypothetical protein ONR75_25270 [Rhodopseudomonas sp. P2A-2r]
MPLRRDRFSNFGSSVGGLLLTLVIGVVSAACIRPAAFGFPSAGLDASWIYAVSNAVEKGAAFGSEIVFTSGPLSSFYHRLYPHRIAPAIIALDCLWLVIFAIQLRKIVASLFQVGGRRVLAGMFMFGLILMAERLLRDGLMLFFVFASGYLYVSRRSSLPLMVASIVVIAGFAMAKFSVGVLALPVFVLIDMLSVTRRKIPYKTVLFLICAAAFFVAAGQPLTGLPAYLQASLEVSQGYSAGMSIDGAPDAIWMWGVSSFAVVVVAAVAAWPNIKVRGPARATAVAHLLLLIGYLSLLTKAGFVRHDAHSLISWTGLFLAIPAVALASEPVKSKHRPFELLLFICFLYLYAPYVLKMPWNVLNPVAIAGRSIATLESVVDFASGPRGWMADKERQFAAARDQLHASAKLPVVSGSVDIIPSRQSEVIAAQLNYRPRPTIQEYTTYTPSLIQRNRDFYLSPKAPEFVYFAPGSIDGRHPASAEGTLWPLLLQRYEPFGSSHDLLVLRRRSQPLPDLLSAPIVRQATLGEWIDVPTSTKPLFVGIDVQYSPLGRFAELVLKPPSIVLRALYKDGRAENYRLIPGMARDGVILVPTVKSANMFLQIYEGAAAEDGTRPLAFEIVANWRQSWAYRSKVMISFAEVDTDILNAPGNATWKASFGKGYAAR